MTRYALLFVFLFSIMTISGQDFPQCPGFLPSRLSIGQQARVSPGDPNNLRSEPTSSAARIGQIPGSASFTVLDGPVCAEGYAWWQVDYDGVIGWTVEGAGETYWLEPIAVVESATTVEAVVYSEQAISPENFDQLQTRELQFTDLRSFAWSPDSRWGAFFENDGIWVKDYTTTDGAILLVRYAQISEWRQHGIAFTHDHLLAYMQDSETIVFVAPDSGEQRFALNVGFTERYVISQDGRLMVTISYRQLVLWDLVTRTERFRWQLQADDPRVVQVAFQPQGSLLAFAMDRDQVTLWDTENSTPVTELVMTQYGNPEEYAYDIAFSPDGQFLAGAGYRQLVLWELASGRKVASLRGGRFVQYSPDGRLLFTTNVDNDRNDWLIYDGRTAQPLANIALEDSFSYRELTFRPDGTAFYVVRDYEDFRLKDQPLEWTLGDGDPDGEISMMIPDERSCPGFLPVRLTAGEVARVIPNMDAVNLRAQASVNSSRLVTLSGGETFAVLEGPQCALGVAWWQVAINETTGWLAEGIADQYFLEPLPQRPTTPQYTGDMATLIGSTAIQHTLVSPDGQRLAVADGSGIWLYDLNNLAVDPVLLYIPDQTINDLRFSPDGSMLAVATGKAFSPAASDINAAWLWNLTDQTLIARLDQESVVLSVAFAPDQQLLAVNSTQKLFLWQIADAYEYSVLQTDTWTNQLIFHPDGRHLFALRTDMFGYIWDIQTGNATEQLTVQIGWMYDVANVFANPVLSPDGLTLASHSGSSIYLWNGVTGTQQQEIFKTGENRRRAEISISDMAFSPDGDWLVTGGDRLRLWDMTFSSVTTLRAELETSLSTRYVAFRPDGQALVAGNDTYTELWDWATRERIAIVDGGYGLFAADGRIITRSTDAIYLWDQSGARIAELH